MYSKCKNYPYIRIFLKMPSDSISEHVILKFSWEYAPKLPSINMLCYAGCAKYSLGSDTCKQYWYACEHFSIDDDLVVCGCHLLMPTTLQQKILDDLHESYQGSVRTKHKARLTLY